MEKKESGDVSQGDIDKLLDEVEQEETKEPAADAAGAEESNGVEAPSASEDQAAEPEPVESPQLEPTPPERKGSGLENARDLGFLMDIPLRVSVEVGRTKMNIGDLLGLGPGSVVELEKLAGEPLDVFINQRLVARGEAVIINEKFGVRLTDVVSQVERIENLKT